MSGPERASADPEGRQGIGIREGIAVEGPDAERFLQGQISQDVEALTEGSVAWSLILQPTGRLVSLFRIQQQGPERYLLDVEAGHRDELLNRLQRFLLRTNATIAPVEYAIDAPLAWPGLTDPNDERQRILIGFPRLGAELTDETIPGEAGPTFVEHTVSFTKGCYTGQELVARIESRGGNVPRPIRVLTSDEEMSIGAEVRWGDEVVGTVTSAVGSVALAPLARRVEVGQPATVDGVRAVVVEPATNGAAG